MMPTPRWDYTAGLVLSAIQRVGVARHDTALLNYVRRNMDAFVQPDGTIRTYRQDEFNLDQLAQGRLLFPLAQSTGDARYRRAADLLREQLRRQPRTAEGGFWHKRIYPQQMWLDGLYMAEPFYAEYVTRYGSRDDLDDVARQFLLAARQAMLAVLRDAAAAAARVQDPVTGVWWQVMDEPNRAGNYLEASASSMFVYAFARAARHGWLPAEYRVAATRGFDGILRQFVTTGADGLPSLTGICSVAGLGGTPYRDGSYHYYVSEPVVADDYKGVGAFILAAQELGR